MQDVKVDGEDHSVTGNPSYDAISVKILGDQGIERIEKQKGKTVATSRMTVSPGGATATVEFTDSSNTNTDPVTYKETVTRAKPSLRVEHTRFRGPGEFRRSRVSRITGFCSR